MTCPHCRLNMAGDCRYCPQCGRPTQLAEESHTLAFSAESKIASAARAAVAAAKSPPVGAKAGRASSRSASPADLSGELLEEQVIHALLTRANLSRLRGNWSDAIDRCVAVLRSQPGNHTAHSLLGDIYRDQGKLDDAIQWYRMALDLKPNPADEAKLRQQERERAKLVSASGRQSPGGQGRRGALPALSSDSGLFAGTAALLGLSPKRWLRGITIASVAFLALMILALMVIQSRRRALAASPSSTMPPAVSVSNTNTIIPPPTLNAPKPTPPPTINTGGNGLPPDSPGNPAPNSAGSSRASRREEPKFSMDLAPVKAVIPLEDDSRVGVGGVAESYNAPPIIENVPLEAGMRITQVQADPAGGSANIVVTAFVAHSSRGLLIRNTYRVARAVFDADNRLTYAHVRIQPDPGTAGNGAPLMSAEIDRFAAAQANPNTDPLDRLAAYLRFLPDSGQPATSFTFIPTASNVPSSDVPSSESQVQ